MYKLSIGKVLGDSFAILGRQPLILLGLAFLMVGLPDMVMGWAFDPGNPKGWGQAILAGDRLAIAVRTVAYFFYVFVLVWAQSLITLLCAQEFSTGRIDVEECFNLSARQLPRIIGLSILFMIMIVGFFVAFGLLFTAVASNSGIFGIESMTSNEAGTIVFALATLLIVFLPLMVFASSMICAVPSILMEKIGVFASISRSWHLTKKSRLRIILCLLVYLVMLLVLTAAVMALVYNIHSLPNLDAMEYVQGSWTYLILTSLSSTFTTAVGIAGIAGIYVGLRTGKEGASTDSLAEVFA